MMQKKKKYAGFTLVEMLIVLLVIAVLVLLFVPSLAGKSTKIKTEGNAAFEKVIDTQVEMYALNEDKATGKITLKLLKEKKYLTEKQVVEAKTKLGYEEEQDLRPK